MGYKKLADLTSLLQKTQNMLHDVAGLHECLP